MSRGQANVVGVALLVGVTVVALGLLTASVGTVVEENAARADAQRVASDLDSALDPVETTGRNRGRVSFADGRLRTVERDVRILDAAGVEERVRAGGVVFKAGDRRVAAVAGAVVRGRGASADMYSGPPLTASDGAGVLVVGVAKTGGDVRVGGTEATVVLRTTVEHTRTDLGNGTYRVAVETATPDPWERFFRSRRANVTRRDIDGDGIESVVGSFPGERRGYLVVHDLNLEVADG